MALVGVSDGRRPEREAVVMLGGENDVLCPRITERLRPRIRRPLCGLFIKGAREVIVVGTAVVLLLVHLCRRAGDAHPVVVPLGIRIIEDVVRIAEVMTRVLKRCPTRDGIETPMDEDAKLRIVVPAW